MPAALLGLASLVTACAFRRLTPLALLVLSSAFARLYYDTRNALSKRANTTPAAAHEGIEAADRDEELSSQKAPSQKAPPQQMPPQQMSLQEKSSQETSSQVIPSQKISSQEIASKENRIAHVCSFVAAILACLLSCTFLIKPSIPSESRLFTPPTKAIEFIAQNPQSGKLFNDSKYGSMMTWTLSKPPDIFIDGRFDSYERQLVYDYLNIRFCRGDWPALLRRYNITWLFLPTDAPLVAKLKETVDWNILYGDNTASILAKKNTPMQAKQTSAVTSNHANK